jgi:hypothetical protein
MTSQPYWIMVLQILAIQLLQRIWSRYRYKLTMLEMGSIRWILWLQIKVLENGLDELLEVEVKRISGNLEYLSTTVKLRSLVRILQPLSSKEK